jgi:penicillin-binding protein 2
MTLLEKDIPFPATTDGVDAANKLVHCDGEMQVPLTDGSAQKLRDWYGDRDLGWLNYHDALSNSCNLFFYAVALGVWENWRGSPLENVIQDEARSLGFGEQTGIDLTGEAGGVVPDRALYESWKEQMLADEDAPKLLTEDRLEAVSPWYGGDLMNLAIGQGGLLATPLQVAAAYATLANGGTFYRPYVVARVVSPDGQLVQTTSPTIVRKAELDPDDVRQLLTDLNRVVTVGTARQAFEGFGDSLGQVGGKTGTGQSVKSKDNHAWFAGVAPIDNPRYAVVVLLDEGGSGGAAAAPLGRYILQYLMGEELDPIRAGQLAD